MPTTPLEPVTFPLLPKLVDEPEPPVVYVRAPRSPFLFPGIAAVVLLAFLGGVFLASVLGVVDLPAPMQAERPRTSPSATTTKTPAHKEIPVVVDNPTTSRQTPTRETTPPREPATQPTTVKATEPPLELPAGKPTAAPPSEPAETEPPIASPTEIEPTATSGPPTTEVPSTPSTDTQTSQPVDTSTPAQ